MSVRKMSHVLRIRQSIQIVGMLGLVIFGMSACNLGTDAITETQEVPLEADTPVAATQTPIINPTQNITPSATFTLTPLPTVPPSLTPITTTSNDDVAPVGERDDPTLVPLTDNVVENGSPTETPDVAFPSNYSDRHTTTIAAGRTLLVSYIVELNNPGVGRVFFVVNGPSGTQLDRWYVTESIEETVEIPVEAGGEHEILVAFEQLRGFYSVEFGFR